jgi:hypothetical protein
VKTSHRTKQWKIAFKELNKKVPTGESKVSGALGKYMDGPTKHWQQQRLNGNIVSPFESIHTW